MAATDLEALFRAHQREVFLYLVRVTGDVTLAEDLAQETFLRAFRGALTYRGESSTRTWLFSIARNVVATHYRKRHVEVFTDDDPEVAARTPDPALRLSVTEALEALPVAAREVLVLCDLLGFEPTQAAAVTGLEPNALRVRLHRARDQFRKVYER